MARDITKLHPILQCKWLQLVAECKKKGIIIKATECVRTVAEQDALYAKGRTVKGSIVTNAKGSSYSSMHQWGVAIDCGLNFDTDKDGDIDINDIYNSKIMKQIPPIEKSIGLESGYYWKSIVDLPHMQLPDWGSTATKLKKQYGTPDKFMKTWWKVGNTYTLTADCYLHTIANDSGSSKITLAKSNDKAKKVCKADKSGYAYYKKGSKIKLTAMEIREGYICGKTSEGYWIGIYYNNKEKIK